MIKNNKILTQHGKQVMLEIAFIKYKKVFSKLTPTQKKNVANIFIKFLQQKGSTENKLLKLRGTRK